MSFKCFANAAIFVWTHALAGADSQQVDPAGRALWPLIG